MMWWYLIHGVWKLKQEQYLVLVSKGPFVPDLTIICLKNFHTWNSVRSTWVYLFCPPSIICFCTSILSFWKIIQFSKVAMTNKPRVSGALAQVHGECVEGCLDSSWTLDHPTVNHNHCLWRCWPPRRIELTMDLETHICRSISLKASYPLNEKNLLFSNLVASLRKLLCELTIVPQSSVPGPMSPCFFCFRFLKFWQSADLSKPLGHPNRLAVPLSSRSFPMSWECGIYLSRSGGKMEGYHPVAVLMTLCIHYTYILHRLTLGEHHLSDFHLFWGLCWLNL